ncbi:MAG: flippase [archaeon]
MKSKKEGPGEIDNYLKRLVKTSIFVFLSLILSKIFTYLYRIIIARSFGAEVYGLYSLAMMVTGILIAFSALGLGAGILRYFSYYRGKKETSKIKYILRSSSKILILSSIFFMLFQFFSAEFIAVNLFHDESLILYLKWFSITIPLLTIGYIFIYALKSFEKTNWSSFSENISQNLVQFIFIVLLIFLGLREISIMFSHIAGAAFLFIIGFIICKYKLPEIFKSYKLNKKEKSKVRKELFNYSWPLMLFTIISSFFYWIDTFAIGYFQNTLEVGLYNAAVPIVSLLYIAPTIFVQLLFPLITKEYAKKNYNTIKELSKQVTKWILILNLPMLAIMLLFPGTILNILFGAEFVTTATENALRLLAIGVFFPATLFISNNLISMAGKSKTILLNMVVVAIVNIVLNILLVPKYGIEGAAFSTMISSVLLGLMFLLQGKYYLSIVPFRRKMLRIVLAIIIPSIIIFYLRTIIEINILNVITVAIFFLLIYILSIIVTGCLDRNDIMIIDSFLKGHKNLKGLFHSVEHKV